MPSPVLIYQPASRQNTVAPSLMPFIPSPNQQRICGIGCTLVTVASALHDKSQIVFAGEIDGRHDIVGRLRRYSVGAGSRRPSVDPAETLRQPNLVSKVIRILQRLLFIEPPLAMPEI